MKKVLPLIIILITLSVLGIMFIQISWIRNAISLKQSQFQREMQYALNQARESIYSHYFMMNNIQVYNEASKEYYLKGQFSMKNFTKEDVDEIIEHALKKYNIRQPYEFSVTNIFSNPILMSDNFPVQNTNSTYHVLLTPEESELRETLYVYVKEDKNYVLHNMAWMIVASIFFTTIIISAFALTVRTLFNQKKLSEIKSDFINNMTHELKTPLATISLAIDALTNEKVIKDREKIQYYSGMIKEENKRMNKQVEKILQAAKLEKQEIKLNLQQLDAHDIIHKVADNLALQIQDRNGTLTLNLNAQKHIIKADEVHFSNIIFNLLDNAMKYSENELKIVVETFSPNNHTLGIKVQDSGIGMSKETQARIFEKFYRAHTGNLHNVKGFGLGLSYVKAMLDAHGGKIKVDSLPGKGSTFIITMPT